MCGRGARVLRARPAAARRAWTSAPDLLLRLEESADTLPTEQRALLETHVADCVSCAEELTALRGFDFGRALAPATASVEPKPAAIGRLVETLRGWLWQPAFAYALVLVLLVPMVLQRFSGTELPELAQSRDVFERGSPAKQALPGSTPAEPARPPDAKPQASTPAPALTPQLEEPEARLRGAEAKRARKVRPVAPLQPPPERLKSELRENQDDREEQSARTSEDEAALADERFASNVELDRPAEVAQPPGFAGRARGAASSAVAHLSRAAAQDPGPESLQASFDSDRTVVRFGVPTPSGVPEGADLLVRVASADGRRELRARVRSAAKQTRVELPGAWMTPGSYRVEVRIAADPPAAQRVFDYELRIPAPAAP